MNLGKPNFFRANNEDYCLSFQVNADVVFNVFLLIYVIKTKNGAIVGAVVLYNSKIFFFSNFVLYYKYGITIL